MDQEICEIRWKHSILARIGDQQPDIGLWTGRGPIECRLRTNLVVVVHIKAWKFDGVALFLALTARGRTHLLQAAKANVFLSGQRKLGYGSLSPRAAPTHKTQSACKTHSACRFDDLVS